MRKKLKKAEEARKRLVNLQICDLCKLESFYCDYEKHLLEIPIEEWSKYVEDFIRKIPFAGKSVLPEYLSAGDVLKGSLAYAKLLITKFMEQHCEQIRIKKAMKSTFKICCSKFPHPSNMYGCENQSNQIRRKDDDTTSTDSFFGEEKDM